MYWKFNYDKINKNSRSARYRIVVEKCCFDDSATQIKLKTNKVLGCSQFNKCRWFHICPSFFSNSTIYDALEAFLNNNVTSELQKFKHLPDSVDQDHVSLLIAFSVHFHAYKHFRNSIKRKCNFIISGKFFFGECFAPIHASHGCCKSMFNIANLPVDGVWGQ